MITDDEVKAAFRAAPGITPAHEPSRVYRVPLAATPGVSLVVVHYRDRAARGDTVLRGGVFVEDAGTWTWGEHQALSRLAERWGGRWPAEDAARAIAALFAGRPPSEPIATAEDLARLPEAERTGVSLPVSTTVDGHPGVIFWWRSGYDFDRTTAWLGAPGVVSIRRAPPGAR